MWHYKNVTRTEFEKAKDSVEQIMLALGAEVYDADLPVRSVKSVISGKCEETFSSERKVFVYNGEFFRVDEVLFSQKPFIVIEFGFLDDFVNNTTEDAEPFPYDLTYEEIVKEVRYSMGIEPYA